MRISLHVLILLVSLLSVILTLSSSITAGYQTTQQTLIDNTLETNRVYAHKLAQTTEIYFQSAMQTLEHSAGLLAHHMGDTDKLLEEADRLLQQMDTFNSVTVAAADGIILATSPQTLNVIGELLNSEGGQLALQERRPLISKPYISITGRLVIFLSHPIFDEAGEYLGLVGGSLYLKEENILYKLLGQHFYQDGSYVYVVDRDGRIIYHQMQDRVNELVPENEVVQQLMQQASGSARITNSKNVDMLAGYAYVPTVEWGIVSQRPTEVSIQPAQDMMERMIMRSLPYLLVTLVLITLISKLIARPLQKLARFTESSTEKPHDEEMRGVSAWYYEAIQLKKALAFSLSFFRDRVNYFTQQSATDQLTKLANRRTFDEQLQLWTAAELPFSIVIIDIDHFKRVNDTYGHVVGDEVLIFLADRMREAARVQDTCCRYGGEEFVLLLHETDNEAAYQIAEQLRKLVEDMVSPSGEHITISAGIASLPADSVHAAELLEIADQRLYEAKRTGRNRSVAGPVISRNE